MSSQMVFQMYSMVVSTVLHPSILANRYNRAYSIMRHPNQKQCFCSLTQGSLALTRYLFMYGSPIWIPTAFRRGRKNWLPAGRTPLRGDVFQWERLNPYTQDCSLVRKVGLDKVIQGLSVSSTASNPVLLFNYLP